MCPKAPFLGRKEGRVIFIGVFAKYFVSLHFIKFLYGII